MLCFTYSESYTTYYIYMSNVFLHFPVNNKKVPEQTTLSSVVTLLFVRRKKNTNFFHFRAVISADGIL